MVLNVPSMSMFWFLKKRFCAHKAFLSSQTIFFLRLTPCWDVPPVVRARQQIKGNHTQHTQKKPAWSVEINGQNYSFWQSSSHITIRPHSYHYWRFHLSGRETETCVCCTARVKNLEIILICNYVGGITDNNLFR